jgi:hypothetical protein
MKRGFVILFLGLIAATAAYGCMYLLCTAPVRNLQKEDRPELAWLKKEFKLGDEEFQRISELHAAYLPECRERCRQVEAQNAGLQKLLADSTNVTPQIELSLDESARLRAECQRMMLQHFFRVSEIMPPEQGRRYLAWVKEKVFLPNHGMTEHH